MGKRDKQRDPLGPRASRVEKERKSQADLPSWYFRLLALRGWKTSFDPTDPRDFDEDLSELEEESEEESKEGSGEEESEEGSGEEESEEGSEEGSGEEDCECDGEDSECDCRLPVSDDSEDDESENSYDGSDADFYYDLKAEREKRKKEKLKERKDKDRQLGVERSKEEEVQAAEMSLKKAQKDSATTVPFTFESLAGQKFRLFCSDHVNHFYNSSVDEVKYVQFIHPDDMPKNDDSGRPDEKSRDDTGMLYARLFLDAYALCTFGPFLPPDSASLRPTTMKSCDGKHKLSLYFLGNGYLKLIASRDMVFMGWEGESPAQPPPNSPAPEVFEFVGIWVDPKKEKAERKKTEMERRRNRHPSPRETWFELNHPMGAYYGTGHSVRW